MMHSRNFLLLLLIGVPAAVGLHTCLASDEAPPLVPETPSLPSAEGFDALYKRLEFGDLTALDTEQQKQMGQRK